MQERNSVIEQTREQADPYSANPRDWEVIEGEPPFHGQCGDTRSEYNKLLKDGEKKANASDFAQAEEHPDANRAGKPRTP